MATKQQMIDGVKAYATEHYEEGWDVVVEAVEDEELLEMFKPDPERGDGRIATVGQAIKRVKHRIVLPQLEARGNAASGEEPAKRSADSKNSAA